MTKRHPLSAFERLAQRLVEGSIGRLLGVHLTPLDLATRAHHALEDAAAGGAGIVTACRLVVGQSDLDRLEAAHPALADIVTEHLRELLRQSGPVLEVLPLIELVGDLDAAAGEPRCELEFSAQRHDTTQVMRPVSERREALQALEVADAFLIVNGRRHLPLTKQAVSIGRRRDNDLVFEDPRVSRQHAQLRWRYGRFVLYDLGSRAGTTVNGQRVTESVLLPGDVIGIGDESLIYGEGVTRSPEETGGKAAAERTQALRQPGLDE
jgi:pSer/pThr/pTyr-binding forkhead associated (FHA) protein